MTETSETTAFDAVDDGWQDLYDAALPDDAPGAWIRRAIEATREQADDRD